MSMPQSGQRNSASGRTLSAFVPCYNNAVTLPEVLAALQSQTVPARPIVVIDDASTDGSVTAAHAMKADVLQNAHNVGRGAVRARALQDITAEYILACDAAIVVPPSFVEQALPHFADPRVAAVFGRVTQPPGGNVLDRWRARHLFKRDVPAVLNERASLATGAVILRRAAVLAVGNFNALLRGGEDAELGERLLGANWKVICDPALQVSWLGKQCLRELLERYGRWNWRQAVSWREYVRHISYSLKVMVRADLRHRDPVSALISLLCPHYVFWHRKHG